eukprot:5613470-Amphidinium_carterae.1
MTQLPHKLGYVCANYYLGSCRGDAKSHPTVWAGQEFQGLDGLTGCGFRNKHSQPDQARAGCQPNWLAFPPVISSKRFPLLVLGILSCSFLLSLALNPLSLLCSSLFSHALRFTWTCVKLLDIARSKQG